MHITQSRKKKASVVAALALTLAPAAARGGPVLGFRTGVGFTGGKIEGSIAMADRASWTTPVQLEAGWKFARQLTVLAFGTFNAGHLDSGYSAFCEDNRASCIIELVRFGVQGQWNFKPAAKIDPWAGLGVVTESLSMEYSTPTSSVTSELQGWGLEMQAGADFWLSQRFTLSPFVAFSMGRYDEFQDDTGQWRSISDKRFHTLFIIGVRGGWEFGAMPRTSTPSTAPEGRTATPPAPEG